MDSKALGKRVKHVRIANNLTQQELAKKAGCSTSFIADIETGRGTPSIETMISVVNVLKTSLDKILYDSLDNVLINNIVNSKVLYDKEIKELIEDLSHEELKIIIDMIKTNKEAIRKSAEIERIKLYKEFKSKEIEKL